jgi:hypothetical protein
MPRCEYEHEDYKCEYDIDDRIDNEFCILHSKNVEKKDQKDFNNAMTNHCLKVGNFFVGFVFPWYFTFEGGEFRGNTDFRFARFTDDACFNNAKFNGSADFRYVTFSEKSNFENAIFKGNALFFGCKFGEDSYFENAIFSGEADFKAVNFGGRANFAKVAFNGDSFFYASTFSGEAYFKEAKFSRNTELQHTEFIEYVNFGSAEFKGDADFRVVRFNGDVDFVFSQFHQNADFLLSHFKGYTDFFGAKFGLNADSHVSFRFLKFSKNAVVAFRDVNLTRCSFVGTDLRIPEITNATWPRPVTDDRRCVYDELIAKPAGYGHIENLYRQLKQNYEDRKDYERARDFHYGEKEMRRKSPTTSPGLWLLLSLYSLTSGYGERLLRPLICAAGLLLISTIGYVLFGLKLKLNDVTRILDGSSGWDWLQAAHYTFRAMTLLKPENLATPIGCAELIFAADSILGPILIGLFALAIRQRLKR